MLHLCFIIQHSVFSNLLTGFNLGPVLSVKTNIFKVDSSVAKQETDGFCEGFKREVGEFIRCSHGTFYKSGQSEKIKYIGSIPYVKRDAQNNKRGSTWTREDVDGFMNSFQLARFTAVRHLNISRKNNM